MIPTKWEMATGLLELRTMNGYMPHPFTILSILYHTKYTVWLWRMIAYVDAVLSPAESAEYKLDMTMTLKGGIQITFLMTIVLNYKLVISKGN